MNSLRHSSNMLEVYFDSVKNFKDQCYLTTPLPKWFMITYVTVFPMLGSIFQVLGSEPFLVNIGSYNLNDLSQEKTYMKRKLAVFFFEG